MGTTFARSSRRNGPSSTSTSAVRGLARCETDEQERIISVRKALTNSTHARSMHLCVYGSLDGPLTAKTIIPTRQSR